MPVPGAVLTVGRRLASDAGENLSPEEQKQRLDYVFALLKSERTGKLARYEAELAQPAPAPPARVVPWVHPHELNRREEDEDLDADCALIEVELEKRHPGAVREYGRMPLYDFTGEPELEARWQRAHDDAETRALERQPPLPVKKGDLVDVGGYALRVASVDLSRRSGSLEALGPDGAVLASSSGMLLDRLRPLRGDPATMKQFPHAPPSMTDGLDRARFHKRHLKAILEAAGLESDGSLFGMTVGYSA